MCTHGGSPAGVEVCSPCMGGVDLHDPLHRGSARGWPFGAQGTAGSLWTTISLREPGTWMCGLQLLARTVSGRPGSETDLCPRSMCRSLPHPLRCAPRPVSPGFGSLQHLQASRRLRPSEADTRQGCGLSRELFVTLGTRPAAVIQNKKPQKTVLMSPRKGYVKSQQHR